jgi:regulator of sirC expression with transglutaminase-like and TPR domain
VADLRAMLRKDYPGCEFNIEGYPDERFLKLVEEERPDLVTLVPDHLPEGRDRGLAHAELGQIDQAVSDLEHYVSQTDDALDRDAIEHRIEELRRERG